MTAFLRFILAAMAAALLAGCAVGDPPPSTQTGLPPQMGVGTTLPEATAGEVPMALAGASTWVASSQLREVLALSLANNRDLRVALANIERARAQYGITEAARLPTVAASAQASRSRTAADLATNGISSTGTQYTAQLAVTSFELDFWGRVRSLNESALQAFLQTEANRRTVQLTLVSDVANAWLNVAATEARLALARDTLAARAKAYQLTERMHQLGATSGLVLAQNRSTVETARGDVAAALAQLAKDRNAVELLVGGGVPQRLLPTAATLGPGGSSAAVLPALPPQLPSSLLLARPDVQAAEFNLRALSANVNAARAAMFPTITLTSSIGTGSRELDALLGAGNGSWSFVPQVRWPLFDGGASRASLEAARAGRDAAVAQYEKAVQSAFREAADALAERAQWQERLAAQQAVLDANAQALQLSEARFQAGTDNYLTVLDAQRSLYAAQQALIALRQAEQANRVTLYKVLGGAPI